MSRRAALRSSRDFRRVYRSGTRARRDGVTVWAVRSGLNGPTRVGLAVRAQGLSAVARNKIRRRLRAIMAAYGSAPGFEVVVGADRGLAGRSFQEVQEDLVGALTAAGVERR